MSPTERQANDFIPYPTDRVVGTIAEPRQAREAIEALLRRGVPSTDIDVLYGESGLHRLDPGGAEHGFWARFQRTLIHNLAVNEESRHLKHHVEDLRAGRIVIMVLVSGAHDREAISGMLLDAGATHMGFFGKLHWEGLDDPTGRQDDL